MKLEDREKIAELATALLTASPTDHKDIASAFAGAALAILIALVEPTTGTWKQRTR